MSKSVYVSAYLQVEQVSDFLNDLMEQGAVLTDYVVWPKYQVGQVGQFADGVDCFVDVGVKFDD